MNKVCHKFIEAHGGIVARLQRFAFMVGLAKSYPDHQNGSQPLAALMSLFLKLVTHINTLVFSPGETPLGLMGLLWGGVLNKLLFLSTRK